MAIIGQLVKGSTEFVRTPKFGIVGRTGSWRNKRYVVPFLVTSIVEASLAGYGSYWLIVSLISSEFLILPYVTLITLSFGYVSVMTFLHSIDIRRSHDLNDLNTRSTRKENKSRGKNRLRKILTFSVVMLIVFGLFMSYLGYADTIYRINRVKAWLNRGEAAGFVEDMVEYVKLGIELLPRSGYQRPRCSNLSNK